MNEILSWYKKLKDIITNDQLYCIFFIIVILYFINMIVGTWKGRKSKLELLKDTANDLLSYTLSEVKGNVVQIINLLLAIALFITLILSTIIVLYIGFKTNIFNQVATIISIVSLFSLIFCLIICTKYTRHYYKNKY